MQKKKIGVLIMIAGLIAILNGLKIHYSQQIHAEINKNISTVARQ